MSELSNNAVQCIVVGIEDYRQNSRPRALSAVRNFYAGTLLLAKEVLVRKAPGADPDEILGSKALIRHARAVDVIFEAQERGGKANPEQVKELQEACKVFEEVRPNGSHDAEAAYKKNPELVCEAAGGQINRAIRALQLETELRIDPSRRAERFVERWQKLDQASLRQYQAGDIFGYKATRSAMGDMAKSLERDPQLESILANRKKDLGIAFESGRRLGQELAFAHGIDLGRGRGIGI
jgi:hypothetical protein